ncbi:NADP-dependent oxidoreductase [Streptomyces sp. N2-109]|uniref:NADP-dependent oxidoreductase n=1 Tax=Streptomyces gossypii TaxID=2883101 RepID=A0ABT2JWE0_9ACTN|nr:NADP-dependent oxidoreductase [Streptomyces gossypii]MCT2591993.1 NADP-dependent oxidoreductase [Streptomyces gossypii]
MRAVVIESFGGPEVLEVAETEVPEPGRGQLRIRVEAAAVNPVDTATSAGFMAEVGARPDTHQPRLGLGWDVAGTVDALGAGTGELTGLAPGDSVIGVSTRLDLPAKTHAEFVVLDAESVTRAPEGLDPVHAATLPLNGLTALQSLDLLALEPGESVLVTGAAGAVGGYVVQLAVLRGLRVVALAGAEDEALVRGLGAELFAARTAAPSEAVRALVPGGVDGVIDAAVIGGRALEAVRDGGALVSLIPGTEPVALRGTRTTGVQIRAHRGQLAQVATLARLGVLSTRVAQTYPLAEAAKAYARLGEGGLRGRVVLVP